MGNSNSLQQLNVVSVSGWLHELFEEVGDGVREKGFRFTHHRDPRVLSQPGILAEADVLFAASNVQVNHETLSGAPRLRALVCPFIGTEGFDTAAASRLGILVVNGQVPENWQSMAEATVMLILTSLYNLRESERLLRENMPHPQEPSSRMLLRKTVGLIGFGRIAQGVSRRLAGWEVRLQTYSPYQIDPLPVEVAATGLDDLLRTSDVVCVLAALTDETRGMLDGTRLRMMKPEAVLVNTARGGIINEADLVEVARERPGLRLAIDTFAVEPLPVDSSLRSLPNAILTPHLVGHTRESMAAIPRVALENILGVLAGEAPASTINSAIIPGWKLRWEKAGRASVISGL